MPPLNKLYKDNATRSATFERATLDETSRTVELSFSSELPYTRQSEDGQFVEILGHKPAEVDLTRLNNKAALLWNHDTDEQIGVVEKAWIDAATKKGRALVRFSKSEDGEEFFNDVKDGIITLVSVGYTVKSAVLVESIGGVDTYRVTLWMPFEISLVSVPADASVGVGRADSTTPIVKPQTNMPPESTPTTTAPAAAPIVTNEAAVQAERSRVQAINTLARQHNVDATRAAEFVNGNKSLQEFKDLILETRGAATAVPVSTGPVVSTAELRKNGYSMFNALRHFAKHGNFKGCFEHEVSQDLEKRTGVQADGILIPSNYRALNALEATAGGNTIGTDKRPDLYVEALRNQSALLRAGASRLTGLVGNISFNRQSATASADWLAEGVALTGSQAAFGEVIAQPRRVGATTPVSKQLLAQSSLDIEGILYKDLGEAVALAMDAAALFGTGGAQPQGVFLDANVNTVTFGGAITWAKVIDFLTQIENANYSGQNYKWIMNPTVYAKVQGILKAAAHQEFLAKDGKMNGYEIVRSTQIPTTGTFANRVLFLDPSQVYFCEWEGMDLTVDPYSLKKEHKLEVTLNALVDTFTRQPKAVTRSTDTGAA